MVAAFIPSQRLNTREQESPTYGASVLVDSVSLLSTPPFLPSFHSASGTRSPSVNDRLLGQVDQQRLQPLLDRLLIVERTAEQDALELLVGVDRARVDVGVDGRVGGAASVQILLALLARYHRIGTRDDQIDQAVHVMQRVLLGLVTHGTHIQLDRPQPAAYSLHVAIDLVTLVIVQSGEVLVVFEQVDRHGEKVLLVAQHHRFLAQRFYLRVQLVQDIDEP
uniref:Uncharacterized protein n=1 Tax=Anopheles dirus TaxID=7168 RepID=A0A182NWA5_9DIPT